MRLKEAFAKSTYRDRSPMEAHYMVALFIDEKYSSPVYDEYERVPVYAEAEAAQRWLDSRGGPDMAEGWEWHVIPIDLVPRK